MEGKERHVSYREGKRKPTFRIDRFRKRFANHRVAESKCFIAVVVVTAGPEIFLLHHDERHDEL